MRKQEHDQDFKLLLFHCFAEFIELFFPDVMDYLDKSSLVPLDKEFFKQTKAIRMRQADLVMRAKVKSEDAFFVIHVEAQASNEKSFPRRMYTYFARIYEKYNLPVYPIAVLSYDKPATTHSPTHTVSFPDFEVMRFQYKTIQLNQLDWRNYRAIANPVAVALMPKMNVACQEQVEVKLEGLRLLRTLKLDPDKLALVAAFFDSYLPLSDTQEKQYQEMLHRLDKNEEEEIMEMITSWERKARREGRLEGRLEVIEKQLSRRLGKLDEDINTQIRSLSGKKIDLLCEALLDFLTVADLEQWLKKHTRS